MRIVLTIIFNLFVITLFSQTEELLTYEKYIDIVKTHHPVMYQSQLLDQMAASNSKMARGGFDPKIEGDWNHKSFDDKNYYSLINTAIKIPTWYGIDLKAGYNRNDGQFLNESDFLPSRGLWNAGISVPLGKGFVIDERRAELKKADVYRSITEQQRTLMINEILYEASIAYLNWQTAAQQLDIANEGVTLAKERLDGTRQSFINGDKPAIDTLESFISVQSRELDYQKANQNLENAILTINNYLWIEGEVPLEIGSNTNPSVLDITLLREATDAATLVQNEWIRQHPELLLYDYKITDIDIDQKLAREELKPDVRIAYNPLLAVANDALVDQFNANDYKLGASISYPILQRKQRGKIELNQIKIQDTNFEKSIKSQALRIKLDTYINNINQTKAQFDLLNATTDNYRKMLVAENRKFAIGESSIFLVNSRERKYLETRYKLINASQKLIFNRFTYLLTSAKLQEVI